jgi:beta-glucosidase
MNRPHRASVALASLALLVLISFTPSAVAQHRQKAAAPVFPWSDASLSPDARADMVLKQMTLDEKIGMVHGQGMPGWPGAPSPFGYLSNGGAGLALGVERLGIPIIQMSDAAYGVRGSAENGRYSTALPSNLGSAASWNTEAACAYGDLIGRELRMQGYNMTLGGGVNLTREPRDGRTFEYMGEDPVLAGTLVGNRIRCEQAQHVIGDIKHYAVNDQENGRNEVDSILSKRALQETDLLAFDIGIRIGRPGAVMCSYNAIGFRAGQGDFACENKYLLHDVLKTEWNFPGFVLSDWGGTHSTMKASAAGLDMEQPKDEFYGEPLKQAVLSGKVPMEQLDDHVRRILRSEFAAGIVDFPVHKGVVDVERDLDIAQQVEEQSIVLLKNSDAILPLDVAKLHSVAIIGKNADMGMISGGGSAQVDPEGAQPAGWQAHVWFPTSPMKSIAKKAPAAKVSFDSGANVAYAAALAKSSDVAIIFVHQWTSEGMDLPTLTLPENQDALVEAVADANPNTIVVLETGTAATMPWVGKVRGIVEAWYGGSRGAQALANVLFGDVNPSGKLPMTFPLSEADLPHPTLVVPPPGAQGREAVMRSGEARPTFEVHYDEGLKVGYKWYDAENKPVLFPFGFGLSYTSYRYSDLKVDGDNATNVSFSVTNTGNRSGTEIAEVYVSLPPSAGEPPKRLVGWSRVTLAAGQTKQVSVQIDPKYLQVFDENTNSWKMTGGTYEVRVGGSSQDLPLKAKFAVPASSGAAL